ncbi:MAG: OsmC family peroxiredoxin [Calditrichaeota bacterium]|nr:MAG: OsmC family peroxiredoxin [Calditrichota bacterium]
MKTARVKWVDGMQFVAEADSGHAIILDSAQAEGGNDTGTRPMELILEGLAGCTAMDVVFILRRKRQQVTGLSVEVEAERAETHPKVYTRIKLKYLIKGVNLSEKAVKDAVELSQAKYCSVSAMLSKTASLEYQIQVAQESAAP